jgi:hypothetical protein
LYLQGRMRVRTGLLVVAAAGKFQCRCRDNFLRNIFYNAAWYAKWSGIHLLIVVRTYLIPPIQNYTLLVLYATHIWANKPNILKK